MQDTIHKERVVSGSHAGKYTIHRVIIKRRNVFLRQMHLNEFKQTPVY